VRLPLAYVGRVTTRSKLHRIFNPDAVHGCYALCGIGGNIHWPGEREFDESCICKNCVRREKELLAKEET
jgi:hypothetical protein